MGRERATTPLSGPWSGLQHDRTPLCSAGPSGQRCATQRCGPGMSTSSRSSVALLRMGVKYTVREFQKSVRAPVLADCRGFGCGAVGSPLSWSRSRHSHAVPSLSGRQVSYPRCSGREAWRRFERQREADRSRAEKVYGGHVFAWNPNAAVISPERLKRAPKGARIYSPPTRD